MLHVSVAFFTLRGGVRTGLCYTFFFLQKHGLNCILKALFLFFFDFCYTFRKIGGGSDPSVTNVTLFLMQASLSSHDYFNSYGQKEKDNFNQDAICVSLIISIALIKTTIYYNLFQYLCPRKMLQLKLLYNTNTGY